MKRLLILSLFVATMAQAQIGAPAGSPGTSATIPVSPGTSATGIGSPSASATSYGSPSATATGTNTVGSDSFNSAVPNTSVPGAPTATGLPSAGNQMIDQVNTAPTGIPTDTTLLNTPSGNPIRQSQEEFNSFPDSTVAPGTGSGTGTGNGTNTGSGTINNNFDSPAPATNP